MTGDPLEAQSHTGGEGVEKIPNIPERTLAGETPGPKREGQGPTGSPPGKGPIESDMILDGGDTIPGHAPMQRIQPRS